MSVMQTVERCECGAINEMILSVAQTVKRYECGANMKGYECGANSEMI